MILLSFKDLKKYEFSQNLEGVAQKLCPPCPFQSWNSKGCDSPNFWVTPFKFWSVIDKVLNWKKYSFNLISNRLTGEFSPIAWDLSFRLHKDRVLCSILKGLSLISVYLFWRYCTPRFYWELSTCQKIVKSYSYWW